MKRAGRVSCRSALQLILLLTLLVSDAAGDPHRSQSAVEAARRRPKPPVGFPVQPGVFRLDGSDPTLPQNDLEPLRQIVGKAEFVAFGESIHTSGGYYEMKHRIFRYLVEQLGFRVFTIESPWTNAEQVAQYVETCEGSPDEALRGLFGVWQSEEVRDLVQWMCDWNQTRRKPSDRVHFHGFDTQQPEDDGPALLGFLERVGVGPDRPIAADLRQCDGVVGPRTFPYWVPESSNVRCQAGLRAVEQLFAEDEERLVAETSKEDLAWARIHLTGLRAYQGQAYYRLLDNVRSTDSRDRGMAEVLLAIHELRYPGLKTAVWAHNFHIAKRVENSSWATPTMGTYLHDALGPGYVALGLIGQEVAIDWPNVGCGNVAPPIVLTVEKLLFDLGYDHLLVDLNFPGTATPLLEPGQDYAMSSARMVPAEQFDAVFFLRHSRAMAPLRWPACQ